MKVIDHIRKANGRALFSFEVLPPLREQNINDLYRTIDKLMPFAPAFIDVTSHREEYVYKKHASGLLEKVTMRKRPGTVGICAAIQYKYHIDTVPHIICGGFSKEETEYALIDLNYLGIENLLALRGDPMPSEGKFMPDLKGHTYAIELLEQIIRLRRGQYLHEETQNAVPIQFCTGVAGYPEKHYEAPNMKTDLHFLKEKVRMGADYIVTQMFFDNQRYFDFVRRCRAEGIQAPIIPGIKPLTTLSQLSSIPKTFNIDIPEALADAASQCANNETAAQLGVEWAVAQCKELVAAGVAGIHFYTLGRANSVAAIAKAVF